MRPPADRVRRLLPSGLTGLAGVACAACCVIPLLLAAGALSGAGWAAVGHWMPGLAIASAAAAAGAWWQASRHHHPSCTDTTCTCTCATR